LLSIKNLDVRLGALDILRDVSLECEAGRITVVVGANGAGKSTLLRTVAGLHRPLHGSITFDGIEIGAMKAHAVAALGISMVPEGRHLFREMTVEENLEIGGYLQRRGAGFAAHMARVYDLFPVLKAHRDRKAKTFSGGQQQMITIGRGLMSDPKLLIIDEMSLGLAPKVIGEILDKIVLLNRQGMSILLVEQNVKQALKIAHQGYVLENGSISIRGSAAALLSSPEVQRSYLGL
jgi:branched-chain amino acid transport system ATP-binding protein